MGRHTPSATGSGCVVVVVAGAEVVVVLVVDGRVPVVNTR
jgi:hypothetical protein